MAILFTKEEKKAMNELSNSVNSVLSYHAREKQNQFVLDQRLERLTKANVKFNKLFNL